MNEFFEVKKENIISNQDFDRLHFSPQRIMIWECSEMYAKKFLRIILKRRVTEGVMLVFLLRILLAIPTGIIPLPQVLGLGLTAILNIAYRREIKKCSKDTLFGIFYQTDSRKLETIYFDKKRSRSVMVDPSDVKFTDG